MKRNRVDRLEQKGKGKRRREERNNKIMKEKKASWTAGTYQGGKEMGRDEREGDGGMRIEVEVE